MYITVNISKELKSTYMYITVTIRDIFLSICMNINVKIYEELLTTYMYITINIC